MTRITNYVDLHITHYVDYESRVSAVLQNVIQELQCRVRFRRGK